MHYKYLIKMRYWYIYAVISIFSIFTTTINSKNLNQENVFTLKFKQQLEKNGSLKTVVVKDSTRTSSVETNGLIENAFVKVNVLNADDLKNNGIANNTNESLFNQEVAIVHFDNETQSLDHIIDMKNNTHKLQENMGIFLNTTEQNNINTIIDSNQSSPVIIVEAINKTNINLNFFVKTGNNNTFLINDDHQIANVNLENIPEVVKKILNDEKLSPINEEQFQKHNLNNSSTNLESILFKNKFYSEDREAIVIDDKSIFVRNKTDNLNSINGDESNSKILNPDQSENTLHKLRPTIIKLNVNSVEGQARRINSYDKNGKTISKNKRRQATNIKSTIENKRDTKMRPMLVRKNKVKLIPVPIIIIFRPKARLPPLLEYIVQRIQNRFSVYVYEDLSRPSNQTAQNLTTTTTEYPISEIDPQVFIVVNNEVLLGANNSYSEIELQTRFNDTVNNINSTINPCSVLNYLKLNATNSGSENQIRTECLETLNALSASNISSTSTINNSNTLLSSTKTNITVDQNEEVIEENSTAILPLYEHSTEIVTNVPLYDVNITVGSNLTEDSITVKNTEIELCDNAENITGDLENTLKNLQKIRNDLEAMQLLTTTELNELTTSDERNETEAPSEIQDEETSDFCKDAENVEFDVQGIIKKLQEAVDNQTQSSKNEPFYEYLDDEHSTANTPNEGFYNNSTSELNENYNPENISEFSIPIEDGNKNLTNNNVSTNNSLESHKNQFGLIEPESTINLSEKTLASPLLSRLSGGNNDQKKDNPLAFPCDSNSGDLVPVGLVFGGNL